jgi:hypothetical protein
MKQALVRKDVKCAFGLLKKRFNILVIPGRSYSQHILNFIMCASIISHNMIIDDERDDSYDDNYHTVTFVVAPPVTYEAPASLTTYVELGSAWRSRAEPCTPAQRRGRALACAQQGRSASEHRGEQWQCQLRVKGTQRCALAACA